MVKMNHVANYAVFCVSFFYSYAKAVSIVISALVVTVQEL
jgi:hypothetical protein